MPPCELYIVRHAIAAERGPDWPDDRRRPLTERGITRFRQSVAGLLWMDAAIDEVFTSPLVRARQTADLLATDMGGAALVKNLSTLAPGHAPTEVLEQLSSKARRHRVALVGHEPGLGELAAYLIGAGRPLSFRKGGACRIDLESFAGSHPGALVWFVTPRVLRRLAR